MSHRSELSEVGHGLSQVVESFNAVPSPIQGAMAVAFNPRSVGDLAAQLCTYCDTIENRHSSLLKTCDTMWSYLHRPIDTDDVSESESSTEDDETKDGICFALGRCVHTPEGQNAFVLRNRLLRIMKIAMPFSGDRSKRTCLGEGRVIMHLVPSLPPRSDGVDLSELSEFWGVDDACLFLHISDMSFSPYDPMVEFASHATDEEAFGAGKGPDETALKVLAFKKV